MLLLITAMLAINFRYIQHSEDSLPFPSGTPKCFTHGLNKSSANPARGQQRSIKIELHIDEKQILPTNVNNGSTSTYANRINRQEEHVYPSLDHRMSYMLQIDSVKEEGNC